MARRAWEPLLLGCLSPLLALASRADAAPSPPGPHVAIHAPERTFSAADIRARLATNEAPVDRLLRELLQHPDQMKTLLTLMERVRELAGDDFRWPDSPTLNDRLADLAERISADEKLLAALKKDPEVAQLAARLAQGIPEHLKDRLRDQAAERGARSDPPAKSNPVTKAPAASKPAPDAPRPATKARRKPTAPADSVQESAADSKATPDPKTPVEQDATAPPRKAGAAPQPIPPDTVPKPPAPKDSIPPTRAAAPKSGPPENLKATPASPDGSRNARRDPLTASLIRATRNLEKVGGPLQDSAAVRRAIQRLETSTPPPPSSPPSATHGESSSSDRTGGSLVTSGLERLTGGTEAISDAARGVARNLRQTQDQLGRFTRDSSARIRTALPRLPKPPPLPRPRLEDLGLSWPAVPKFAASVPALPAFSARASLPWLAAGTGLLVAALLLPVLLRLGIDRKAARARSRPPLPDPETIKDRPTLRHAVEQLALAVLGESARADHHLRLAARLFEKSAGAAPSSRFDVPSPPPPPAASELAGLYERARYLPPEVTLAPEEIERGRRRCIELAMKYPN